jgi:curved DNA-binding protein
MEYRDYYAVLGVPKTATQKEIRSAFRKLARQHHPDVNPGNDEAEARFKQINEANEVLSDPGKRAVYDALGPRWKEYEQYRAAGGTASPAEFAQATAEPAQGARSSGRSAPAGRGRAQASPDDMRDLFGQERPYSDFFESVFGQARASGRSTHGADAQVEVAVTLEEAFRGTARQIQFADPATGARAIEARIPPGVRDGSSIRLRGQGGAGQNGGPPGDLYLVVSVVPHPRFQRDGDDLRREEPVDLYTCVLGGEIPIETLKGSKLAVRIPPETQNGKAIRLKGQGMPHLKHPEVAGDLYIIVKVVLPVHLNQEERDMFGRLAARRGHSKIGGHV